ncbi:MAG: arylsulfotransferase family protein [Candidatus Eisenbacteria bacterium]
MLHRPTGRMTLAALLFAAALAVVITPGCGREDSSGGEESAAADDDWGEPGGRWHSGDWMEVPLDVASSMTQEQREEFERLLSIGYLAGHDPVPANSGILIYDGPRTWNGLNFYTSGHSPGAILMDMRGNILHEWKMDFRDAWRAMPGEERPRSVKSGGFWRRAHLFENGDVIGIYDWLGIVKIDKDSDLIWAHFAGFHHDLEVLPDGRIITLVRLARIVPRIHPEMPILEDFIVVLDSQGNELSRVSVLEALEDTEHEYLLDKIEPHGDIFHTNTVELLDGRLADEIPAFREGNVLITIRQLGSVAVIDLDTGKAVWSFDGHWRRPHQATVLENRNILIFDNRGNHGRSQVVEFDPVTLGPVWIYRGTEPDDFYSDQCGSNQRLPNGNTLITESDRGKAFETTPDGETVWKYMNTAHARKREGEELTYIASIFEMLRLPADFPIDWASGPLEPAGTP